MNLALSIGMIFAALVLGYLFGSFASGVFVGKVFFHKDPRMEGSHNSGGTNTGRLFGKKIGVLVIAMDVFKTILAIWITYFVLTFAFQKETLWMLPTHYALLAGFGACIGHTFPLFANFKGGKAVACYAGCLLGTNWLLAVIGCAFFFLILKWKKYVSLASIVATLLVGGIAFVPFFAWSMNFAMDYDVIYPMYLVLLSFYVMIRHHQNIHRLLRHEERKIKWM